MNVTSINYPKYHRVREKLYKSRLQEIVAQKAKRELKVVEEVPILAVKSIMFGFQFFEKKDFVLCNQILQFFFITIKPNSKVMVS